MTRKWYATLRHPKIHPHTKFGIPTSKNIGDMHQTRSGTDGRTVRLLYASQSSFGVKNFKIIDTRISFYSRNTHPLPPKPTSSFRNLKRSILDYHMNYVLVPADEAANNVGVV